MKIKCKGQEVLELCIERMKRKAASANSDGPAQDPVVAQRKREKIGVVTTKKIKDSLVLDVKGKMEML